MLSSGRVSPFLRCRLDGVYLSELAKMHYQCRYNPPRKAFDVYSAKALSKFMESQEPRGVPGARGRRLFYSQEYGISLVSRADTWDATLESYVSRIDTQPDAGDSDFVRTKKEYFQREIGVIRTIPLLPYVEVLAI